MRKNKRTHPRTKSEQALELIYAEIPGIPACTGACAAACGPIVMFDGEWKRVKRAAGRTPLMPKGSMTCPLLSPTGKCTVYTMRPYICRLWGTVRQLRCPDGCEPERWLSIEEARDIFERLRVIAGPGTSGPVGPMNAELWEGFALEARKNREDIIERIKEAVQGGGTQAPQGG